MESNICLLLDAQGRVVCAKLVLGSVCTATEMARRLGRAHDAWGYEIWREGKQVVSAHDCAKSSAHVQSEPD